MPENDDDPHIIAETRQYLRDFNRLNTATTTTRELYDAMLEICPDRVNPRLALSCGEHRQEAGIGTMEVTT